MINLSGIFPPVPTTFDYNEELNTKSFADNIHALSSYDIRGFLVLGSNGEMVMLSEQEKQNVYEANKVSAS